MTEIGKLLLILGIILSLMGLIFIFAAKVPGLGKLPGDIFIKKGNITFWRSMPEFRWSIPLLR